MRAKARAIAEFLGDPVEETGRTLSDSAKLSSAHDIAEGVFRREGEFWTIACCGEVIRLRLFGKFDLNIAGGPRRLPTTLRKFQSIKILAIGCAGRELSRRCFAFGSLPAASSRA